MLLNSLWILLTLRVRTSNSALVLTVILFCSSCIIVSVFVSDLLTMFVSCLLTVLSAIFSRCFVSHLLAVLSAIFSLFCQPSSHCFVSHLLTVLSAIFSLFCQPFFFTVFVSCLLAVLSTILVVLVGISSCFVFIFYFLFIYLFIYLLIYLFIGRAKRALHTSESQLRSDMYICLYHKVNASRSMRVHSQRLCSSVNISTRGAARSSLFCAYSPLGCQGVASSPHCAI